MSEERKAHVRDIVCTRLFMREIMKEVGPTIVQNALTRVRPGYHGNAFLVDLFEEEFNMLNWGKFELDKMYWRKIDDGIEMLATPKVDSSIVRVEEEEEDVVEVIEVVATPPKPKISNKAKGKSPCITTPDIPPPKMSKKRMGRTHPKRVNSKKLRFDSSVGGSH